MLSTEFLEHEYDNHSIRSYDILNTSVDSDKVSFDYPNEDIENTLLKYEYLTNHLQQISNMSVTRLTIHHLIKNTTDPAIIKRLESILTKILVESI